MSRRAIYLGKIWEVIEVFRTSRKAMVGMAIIIAFAVMAIFAPYLAPYNPYVIGTKEEILLPPSREHPLGTNEIGQDILSELIYASRVSLLVALVATLIAMGVGTAIGVLSGYYGGLVDEVFMRVTDFFLVVPALPLMIVLATFIGRSIQNIIFVIGITSWPGMARVIRSQVLPIKERPFIERSRAIGCGDARIIVRHILPNVASLVLAEALITIPVAILSESTLRFIGLGDPLHKSWGMMLHYAFEYGVLAHHYFYVASPGICIMLLAFGFSLIGNALEEVFNPKLRRGMFIGE